MRIQKNDSDIVVLGAGVSGLSTAISLLLAGYQTRILAADPVGKTTAELSATETVFDVRVASNYAMASAYPHNLLVKNLPRVSDDSQNIFKFLHDSSNNHDTNFHSDCIELHHLFEVFECEPEPAPLSAKRMNFVEFSGKPSQLQNLNVPCRPGAEYLWGFCFDTYFADMPRYMRFLWDLFEDLGGQFSNKNICTKAQIADEFPNKIVVNCLGLGSMQVFADTTTCNIMRGQQLIVPSMPRPVDKMGRYLAYNYTPAANIFSRADGTAEYVHFFSRTDGWVLGQTREPGTLGEDGQWHGASVKGPKIKIGDQELAQAILSLNEELIANWQNIHLPETDKMVARYGLRYYRDPATSGVRLEVEKLGKSHLVHNYGHGGSGITMSWGCAIEVVRFVRLLTSANLANRNISSELARGLQSIVLNAVA